MIDVLDLTVNGCEIKQLLNVIKKRYVHRTLWLTINMKSRRKKTIGGQSLMIIIEFNFNTVYGIEYL